MPSSETELLEDIRDVAVQLGRPPSLEEYREYGTVSVELIDDHFDGWDDAVEAADLEPWPTGRRIPSELLLDDIYMLAEELGRAPSAAEYREHGRFSAPTVTARFGSWNEALEIIGVETRPGPTEVSRETVIEDIQAVAEELGRKPTNSEYREHGTCLGAVKHKFESWNAALEAAGFEPRRAPGSLSDETYLERLRELADELDRIPRELDMNEHGPHSVDTYKTRFGSWIDALEAAGLEPDPEQTDTGRSGPISRVELLAELRRLADEVGEPPTLTDLERDGQYSKSPYYNRFDSWADALEAAGLARDETPKPDRTDQ